MAAPFLIVAIGAGTDGGARELAHATVAFFVAGTVANLVWGQLADRAGFRAVFLIGAGIWLDGARLGARNATDGGERGAALPPRRRRAERASRWRRSTWSTSSPSTATSAYGSRS